MASSAKAITASNEGGEGLLSQGKEERAKLAQPQTHGKKPTLN